MTMKPDLHRTPMAPPRMERTWRTLFRTSASAPELAQSEDRAGWRRAVAHRLRMTFALALAATAGLVWLTYMMLSAQQMPQLVLYGYLAVYTFMSFFMSSSFFKMVLGTWHAVRGAAGNPWHPLHTARDPRPDVRVAILFPVYHEDSARVAAGIAATWASLEANHPGSASQFDVFLLSDSRKLEFRIAEEAAVYELEARFPDGRFYYRTRRMNQNAKLGNIADFCRRWGSGYEYALVMDADSVMDGDAILALFRMMEGNAAIGILQTNPKPVLRKTLFGRMQQFSSRLYGEVFSYSLQAMYMGHASYIGHNALIRLKPFIDHCMLPILPGRAPWGGKPLSHDIVESAMMARAGYEVWFLPEVEGSYEELPANLSDFLVRERRWMQGNLQHMRLLFVDRLHSIYRETFLTGSAGYAAAPLWAGFLLLSAYGIFHFLGDSVAILTGVRMLAIPLTMLFASSLVFLFMPRLISLAVHIGSSKAAGFGGKDKLVWSLLLETVFSLLYSPILMICLSYFLFLWLKGRAITWTVQSRGDDPLDWDTCLRRFGWVSVLGIAGLAGVSMQLSAVPEETDLLLGLFSDGWMHAFDLAIWLYPVLIGFAASVLIARLTSLSFPSLEACRLFATPEEIAMPSVVQDVLAFEDIFRASLPSTAEPRDAVTFALSDARFYLRHRPGTRPRKNIADVLHAKIANDEHLNADEISLALTERTCFDALHVAAKYAAE